MAIYGTALLAACLLIGVITGRLLGAAVGVDADIGGVGIAMLLLIVSCEYLKSSRRMTAATESGIAFWGSIYVPIVVAMAASQNVLAAVSGGAVAILAGVMTVAFCFVLVAVFVKLGNDGSKD